MLGNQHLASVRSACEVILCREYDFEAVVSVATLVYGFTAAVPALLWFLFRQLEQPVKFITLLCLYGYALFIFVPASVTPLL